MEPSNQAQRSVDVSYLFLNVFKSSIKQAGWPNGKALDYDYRGSTLINGIKRLQVRSLRRSER